MEDKPQFQWPLSGHPRPSTETTPEITTTIKQIITTIIPETSPLSTISLDKNPTFSAVLSESSTSSLITEMIESESTVTASTEATAPQITTIKEIINLIIPESTTLTTPALNETATIKAGDASFPLESSTVSHITEMVKSVVSESTSDNPAPVIDDIVTTTENLLNTVSGTISSVVSDTTEANLKPHTSFQPNNDYTIYIILAAILGIAILITIIFIIVYKRFKARRLRSNIYCVTDLNEISVSSSTSNSSKKPTVTGIKH